MQNIDQDPPLDALTILDAASEPGLLRRLKSAVGLDRAIFFTVLARVLQAAGSIGTILMIVRWLSPAQQGYYYSLWSLVALQSIFELGFSFVVLQMAAHEVAHVSIEPNGSIRGNGRSVRRLASLVQRALRYYLSTALLMGFVFEIGGSHFFSLRDAGDGNGAIWHTPLWITVFACCLTFAIGPVLSFLEGCGQVTRVAQLRFFQSLIGTAMAWTALLTSHGLLAPAMVLTGQGGVALIFLYTQRGFLVPLLRMDPGSDAISWRTEVLPFQWKIAVSWLCDYFVFQLFTPVLFAFRGPVEAGRIGLSMSVVTQLGGIILVWMTTKAAPFGSLVARKKRKELDRIFARTLRQSVALFAAAAALTLGTVISLRFILPSISHRIVDWPIFLLLLLTSLSGHIVQSEALYLRAHKVEPFLVQSIVVAAATTGTMFLIVKPYGTSGVALSYFLILGVGGIISSTLIFRAKRKSWDRLEQNAA